MAAPLLEGEIRSAFVMTEPEVASSDATNIQLRIERDGDEYVLNGRKWWASGAMRDRCKVFIVMGKTDPDGPTFRQQSMILVEPDTPGVNIIRNLPVFGYIDQESHAEIVFEDVRVPAANLIANEGDGFLIAQARLGPGRIHHCMRTIGAAERALELMCERAASRVTFGKPIARAGQHPGLDRRVADRDRHGAAADAEGGVADGHGRQQARADRDRAIKVAAPNVALKVIDRAIQVHGGGGVSDDFPLATMYAHLRTLRFADGPDEVHKRTIARQELRKLATRSSRFRRRSALGGAEPHGHDRAAALGVGRDGAAAAASAACLTIARPSPEPGIRRAFWAR